IDVPVAEVRANRGANGIDGQLSSWLGITASDPTASWAIVGDLTTLYDLSAPFLLDQLAAAERTLVIMNNGGGGIFEGLPQLREMHPDARGWLKNSPNCDFSAWAAMWRLPHLRIT